MVKKWVGGEILKLENTSEKVSVTVVGGLMLLAPLGKRANTTAWEHLRPTIITVSSMHARQTSNSLHRLVCGEVRRHVRPGLTVETSSVSVYLPLKTITMDFSATTIVQCVFGGQRIARTVAKGGQSAPIYLTTETPNATAKIVLEELLQPVQMGRSATRKQERVRTAPRVSTPTTEEAFSVFHVPWARRRRSEE